REEQARRRLVETDELVLRDVAPDVRAPTPELGDELGVLRRADDDELAPDGVRGVDRVERLLARLDRADEEQEGVVLLRGTERRIWCERRDRDLLRPGSIHLDEVALRALGDREDVLSAPYGAPDEDLEREQVPEPEDARVALPRQILNGEHRRRGTAQRQRVHEVCEGGTQASQQARHADRHSQLLR